MGHVENAGLFGAYPDRRIWLIEPDQYPLKLEPYPSQPDTHYNRVGR